MPVGGFHGERDNPLTVRTLRLHAMLALSLRAMVLGSLVVSLLVLAMPQRSFAATTASRDVAFTLLAARDPRTGYARAGDLASLDTVLTPDDSTAVLRFSVAPPGFPLVLCELPVLPEHLLRGIPRSEMRRASFNLAPVGNGPFRFVERIAGQRWEFVRNDDFPIALGGPPQVARLVVAVVDEPTTKFAGLASGDLDFAGIAPSMASLARRDPTLRVVDYPVLQTSGLLFNAHRPPFDDGRVRRAVDLSIDRDRIIQAALAGYARAASGPVAPESPFALPRENVRNPHTADSLLDAAGWHRGPRGARARDGKPMSIELLTVGSGDQAVEQLVQADLAERGIRVEIRVVEFGAFLARARAEPKAFDALLTGIPGDLSLAYLAAMYDGRQRGSALDYSAFHTPRLDSLFGRTRSAVTRGALVSSWRSVQAELARQHLSLKTYDCYRPERAVRAMWRWAHDGARDGDKSFYPNTGKRELFTLGYIAARSKHSTGTAVDLTLIPLDAPALSPRGPDAPCTAPAAQRAADNSLDMGTAFDCLDVKSYTRAGRAPAHQAE